jgi:molybdopterin synthase sulfur carrier subunit
MSESANQRVGESANQQISIKVRFFAAPREALGKSDIEMTLPEGSTVANLIEQLKQDYPILRAYTRFLSVAVNKAYVGWETELHDGDEIACLPPVGGG